MRDRATVEVALMAAETGHLVLSTLHTVDAGQSINRILGLFSLGEEQQLRIRLADTLRYIVSQRLAPKVGGGRQLLTEILGHNLRTKETIALGEGEHRSFYEIIEASSPFGWMTFDQSILNAYENDLITEETASLFASRKGRSPAASTSSKKRAASTTTSTPACASTSRPTPFANPMENEPDTSFFDSATTPRSSASITSNTRRWSCRS